MIAALRAAGTTIAAVLAALAASATAVAADLELSVTLDPVSRAFAAQARLQPPAGTFRFLLHESLAVTQARAGGTALTPAAGPSRGEQREWTLRVPAGARVEIDYQGSLPALDSALDHRDVLRALPPMASAGGSYLGGGSGWYPAPARHFSYRVDLAVAGGQRALVPGRLLAESQAGGSEPYYRASYAFEGDAEGIVLMAGPWVVRERIAPHPGGGQLRLRTWFPTALDAEPGLAQAWLDESLHHIQRYSERIGAYPYTEFSIVAAPLPTGFGMPGLTYLGADLLRLPFIRATSLGHEVLHNWWGNGVLVADDGGNWSEGLTTFMADYAYKEAESPAAAQAMRLGWLRDFAAVPAQDRQPLSHFRSRTHAAAAAVGYGKSAMLFVMLRDQLGEAAFERGLRRFWQERRFQPSSWDDLRAAFEAEAGRDLGRFFQAWLVRADAPSPTLAAARATPGTRGSSRLRLSLQQAAPPYPLHLPVELRFRDRNETRWISIDATRAEVTLDLPEPPLAVRLDPELRVWRELSAAQLPPILRQWISAAAPRLMVAGNDAAFAEGAAALAARLFESPASRSAGPLAAELSGGRGPLLLIGEHDAVDAALQAAGQPPRPDEVGRQGSAQVWTVPGSTPPLAVVSVRDAAALQALLRPLPHYGAQSWLVFDGARALVRGSWPLTQPALAVPPTSPTPAGATRH